VIGAFNSVYTALQGFFSRSFWFATFLPVALFAALHLVIAVLSLGPIKLFGISLSLQNELPAAQLVSAGPAIIIILVVIGYALLPLMPRFRGLLDGSLLPPEVHDWLREARRAEANDTLDLISTTRADQSALKSLIADLDKTDGKLRAADKEARKLSSAPVVNVVESAERELKALKDAISAKAPMAAAADRAQSTVIAMLAVNNPDLTELVRRRAPALVTPQDAVLVSRTNHVSDRFEALLSEANREVAYRYGIVKTRIRVAGALENPRATSIGDARFVVERYAQDVYQVDFNFLWPRLLVAMKAEKADDPVLDAIENARATVDFAVLSLVLAASIPVLWLPVLLSRGGPAWLFLVIGAATPLVLRFFYELVFEGQLAFGDVVKTAIDKSRFLVLKMLRLAEPVSRSEERSLWTRIAQAEEDGRRADLLYTPAKPAQGQG
jgi:hypothetical protein